MTLPRLFIRINNSTAVNQVIGKNKIESFTQIISRFLSPPDPTSYTSDAFHQTAATWLADAGIDMTII